MKIHALYYKLLSRKVLTVISGLFVAYKCVAQRYRPERTYDIVGLADGDEISNALGIGIPLIIVGLLIAYFSMWRNKDNEKGSTIGCIGIVIIGIGLFALLPLWTWVEAIGVTLVNVIIGIGIILAIIYYIYKALKK